MATIRHLILLCACEALLRASYSLGAVVTLGQESLCPYQWRPLVVKARGGLDGRLTGPGWKSSRSPQFSAARDPRLPVFILCLCFGSIPPSVSDPEGH